MDEPVEPLALLRACRTAFSSILHFSAENRKARAAALLDDCFQQIPVNAERLDWQDLQRIFSWAENSLSKQRSVGTVYQDLKQITRLVEYLGLGGLLEKIQQAEPGSLGPPGQTSLREYYAAIRSFFRYASGSDRVDIPASLRIRQPKTLEPHRIPSAREVSLLIEKLRASLKYSKSRSDETLLALILLIRASGIRKREALTLRLQDLALTDRLTVCIIGKGDRVGTVECLSDENNLSWEDLSFLRTFWLKRNMEENGNLNAFLFREVQIAGTLAPAARQFSRRLDRLGYSDGFHALRNLFANQLRARQTEGGDLLSISNRLRHHTTTTAPRNYVQVLPLLQKEQLLAWAKTQQEVEIPETQSVMQFARLQQISLEGAYQQLKRAEALGLVEKVAGRGARVSLDELVRLLRAKINSIQG